MHTSEWVSPGHPDKVADGISSYLLDRFLEKDPNVRFAVETVIKGHDVTLAGELTSTADFSQTEIESFVREAYAKIGYTDEYSERWGGDETVASPSSLKVHQFITKQSPDIGIGVENDGWGDQGVFIGYATADKDADYMPLDCYLSRKIGKAIYDSVIDSYRTFGYSDFGIDIKTLVSVNDRNEIERIVVAVPAKPNADMGFVKDIVRHAVKGYRDNTCGKYEINCTGNYVIHGSNGDSGLTGRKLAVDFYGTNCPVGGGSPWAKDPTKADVTLNIFARKLARSYAEIYGKQTVVKISCAIAEHDGTVYVSHCDGSEDTAYNQREKLSPKKLIAELGLLEPRYFERCLNGLIYAE